MIKQFVERFMAAESALMAEMGKAHPNDYDALVKRVVEVVSNPEEYSAPDPERITVIDHGDYQGTRLYIIGGKGYQPSNYWAIFVDYGSCSGCDALEGIRGYKDEITAEQAREYWTLMLHMVQNMRRIDRDEEDLAASLTTDTPP